MYKKPNVLFYLIIGICFGVFFTAVYDNVVVRIVGIVGGGIVGVILFSMIERR